MKKIALLFIIIIVLFSTTYGQSIISDGGYILGSSSVAGELLSNSIIDIKSSEDFEAVFLATGKGLSRFEVTLDFIDSNQYNFIDSTWTSFTQSDGLGKGGISALEVRNGMIWLATAFDTTTSLGSFTAGGGLSWTANPDTGWAWMPQPVDSSNDPDIPNGTTTNIQNITYDIAITDTTIWIASFGGGLRKYSLQSEEWYNIPPDDNSFNAYAHLNHRAFSVIAPDSLLFVGTAAGINRSSDGGESWENFNFEDDGISGNFVTALAHQHYANRDIIWAATWPTEAEQYHSVSKSEDWGQTWTVCDGMNGQFTHNFAFDDSIVYAATDEGMWKSVDYGESWYPMPLPQGVNNGFSVLESEVYAGGKYGNQFWMGTSDGLASTPDYGNTWFVYRAFQSTSKSGQPATYAYPNPYSPARWQAVRFQYHLTAPAYITVKIYDFAMDYVATVVNGKYRGQAGDYYETWNGRNSSGEICANGVYFYKLEKSGQGTAWGKIIILD